MYRLELRISQWRLAIRPGAGGRLSSFEKGGLFGGERPEDVAEGLCEMFGKGGGVVAGKAWILRYHIKIHTGCTFRSRDS